MRLVSDRLSLCYDDPPLHNKEDPLDELIFIILSAKTAEHGYLRTYEALKTRYQSWFEILDASPGYVESVIAAGGLAEKKGSQIRALLTALQDQGSQRDLDFLTQTKTEEAENFLTSLPGVGLKTARCVLMFSLGRKVFPVDTHIRRVLSRLGIIEFQRLTDSVQTSIQEVIPPDIRYKLHVNLVAHGRATCRSRAPLCKSCVINDLCNYYSGKSVQASGS